MVLGGIVEFMSNNGLIKLPSTFEGLGFLIYVISMIFFRLIWLRYYNSKKSGRKMIEDIQE